MKLRPTQKDILQYESGKMAVAAVPGSGKTFTLTRLAAKLIGDGRLDPSGSQQILIVTYLNASVDTFKSRIRELLIERELPPDMGYDVRTLHSLGLEIVRSARSTERGNDLIVLDDAQSAHFRGLAIDNWKAAWPDVWFSMVPDDSVNGQAKWRRTVDKMVNTFIREAKNGRYRPADILSQIQGLEEALIDNKNEGDEVDGDQLDYELVDEDTTRPILNMCAMIYADYQRIVQSQGALDFNDLIWQATEIIDSAPEVTLALRQRWPYVLEDEAQDSVPLQEILLDGLTGEGGNWVRVGDPNQAITSTFTAAHPRFFNAFLERSDVVNRPLPHSSRCAPRIFEAANKLVDWTIRSHPVIEVRESAFRDQQMLPAPEGDAKPNPPDELAGLKIRVFEHREDEEIPRIAFYAEKYVEKFPERTIAVLVPTNDFGHKIAEIFDERDLAYDNLLRGGTREREIAGGLYAALALITEPTKRAIISKFWEAMFVLEHPFANVDDDRAQHLATLLNSVILPESLFYPEVSGADAIISALPKGVTKTADLEDIGRYVQFAQRIFELRYLPIDDLIISVADELLAWGDDESNETDLAIAYQIANQVRAWADLNPEWRLPELVEQLKQISEGRVRIATVSMDDTGFEPTPGRITLNTQHGSKGMEWDAVFLVGIDGGWIPGSLEGHFQGVDSQLGVDPSAEISAALHDMMDGGVSLYPGRSATESAHIEVISERLRLLYVGITRAKLYLHISRSRKKRQYRQEQDAEPASAIGVLYKHMLELDG
ncbi:MAG: ATP-dependent helicase [Chloroflexota bacterium]